MVGTQARPHTRWEETAGPTDNPVMHPLPTPAFTIRFRPEKGKEWNDQQVRCLTLIMSICKCNLYCNLHTYCWTFEEGFQICGCGVMGP